MPRKRIHELAKEWGVDTRQMLTRLEEQGIHGKKAQSTLTDHEIALVRPGAVSQAAPSLVLGEEKLVHERVVTEMDQKSDHLVTAREEVRERRISNAVIHPPPDYADLCGRGSCPTTSWRATVHAPTD
ncbi:MAG: hypothetical protein E6J80_05900 [Deltaproteobacteria bacterium]|nr:MAG: hypothetical protein E6J80_05900 [Deltaproteobacteria bacterium]